MVVAARLRGASAALTKGIYDPRQGMQEFAQRLPREGVAAVWCARGLTPKSWRPGRPCRPCPASKSHGEGLERAERIQRHRRGKPDARARGSTSRGKRLPSLARRVSEEGSGSSEIQLRPEPEH